jgi:hypothetical protein
VDRVREVDLAERAFADLLDDLPAFGDHFASLNIIP